MGVNQYNIGPGSTIFPESAADIKAELQNIEYLIKSILDDPTKFSDLVGGSVKISMNDYVKLMMERRKDLRDQLRKVPFWVQGDLEGTI